jgi:Fur family ferric uptake transcriptional regulator
MGKSTVYRQLARLCEGGLLRRFEQTDGAGGAVHTYQYVAPEQDCGAHFHLKCSVCGRVSHLECELTETVAQHLREHHGFVVHCGDSILHGICLDCQNKRKENGVCSKR